MTFFEASIQFSSRYFKILQQKTGVAKHHVPFELDSTLKALPSHSQPNTHSMTSAIRLALIVLFCISEYGFAQPMESIGTWKLADSTQNPGFDTFQISQYDLTRTGLDRHGQRKTTDSATFVRCDTLCYYKWKRLQFVPIEAEAWIAFRFKRLRDTLSVWQIGHTESDSAAIKTLSRTILKSSKPLLLVPGGKVAPWEPTTSQNYELLWE
jgi:hypothetical protein